MTKKVPSGSHAMSVWRPKVSLGGPVFWMYDGRAGVAGHLGVPLGRRVQRADRLEKFLAVVAEYADDFVAIVDGPHALFRIIRTDQNFVNAALGQHIRVVRLEQRIPLGPRLFHIPLGCRKP